MRPWYKFNRYLQDIFIVIASVLYSDLSLASPGYLQLAKMKKSIPDMSLP